MTTKTLLFAAGLVAAGSLSAQTNGAITTPRVIDSTAIVAERLTLFEAERDFVMGQSDLSPEAVASRKAEFISQNFEKIVELRRKERIQAKALAAAQAQLRIAREVEIAAVLGDNTDVTTEKNEDRHIEAQMVRELYKYDYETKKNVK